MNGRRAVAAPQQDRSIATRRRLLDAALDELLEAGYARFTTQAAAQRAGVSRGGQQHHFPSKDVLIEEVLGHLYDLQLDQLRSRVADAQNDEARVGRILDIIFEQYSGARFAATLELALAARTEPRFMPIVARAERAISRAVNEAVAEVFGIDPSDKVWVERWALAAAMVRGVALLRTLGHPETSIARQWRFTRSAAMNILLEGSITQTGAPSH